MIGTGSTLAYAARACRAQGAQRVLAAAAHGLFVGNAAAVIGGDELDRILVTDTVPPFRLAPELVAAKLTILSVASLFGEAIRRMHDGGSLVELLDD
jgi:ribose-phosphate pyrophosphokinase